MNRLHLLLLCLLFSYCSFAQQHIGGEPLSFSTTFQSTYKKSISTIKLNSPSKTELENVRKRSSAVPLFSIPIATDLDLKKDGNWIDLPNGNRIWQLQLTVPNAKGLIVFYDDFYLPKGSKLFVYAADKEQLLGAYTHQNNSKSERFLTGIIESENVVIEYYEPGLSKGKGRFHIPRVDYVLEETEAQTANDVGFGTANECQIDVNCSNNENIKQLQRSASRIMMVLEEGTGWCTGNLINNTASDGTPLLLSAYHCFDGYTPQFDWWRFDFNYEHVNCSNTSQEPDFQSVVGCELKAAWQDSDFALYEIARPIPSSFNVYFGAWNANSQVPTLTTMIHHPRGDVKKLTLTTNPAIIFAASIGWSNGVRTPSNHHFRVTMGEGGGYDIGSSGGALFNESQQIVGQLHGGFPDSICRSSTAYVGRLAISWEGGGTPETRLKDWLDSSNTGRLSLNGLENPFVSNTTQLQGNIQTPQGVMLPNVDILMDGMMSAQTDLAGNYLIDEVSVGESYSIRANKIGDPRNGASTRDLILIQKHVINVEPFTDIYQLIASDINRSQRISTFDLLELHKIILNRLSDFPDNTTWQFIPQPFEANVENFDFNFPEQATLEATETMSPLNFVGVKTGDVNGSVRVE